MDISASIRRARPFLLALAFVLGSRALAQEGGRVAGIVTDEQGKGVEGVTVKLVPGEGNVASGKSTLTDKKGRWSLINVPSGPYTPALESTTWFLKKVEFSARGMDGTRLGGFKEDSVPEHGVPSISVAALQRSELNFVVGNIAEAREALRSAAVQDAKGRLTKLNDLLGQKSWDEAIKEADAVLAKYPDLGEALWGKGLAFRGKGDFVQAVEAFKSSYQKSPDKPGIRGAIGQGLLEVGDAKTAANDREGAVKAYSEAADYFAEELKLQPNGVAYQTNLVIALDKAGKSDDAIRELQKLIALAPDKPLPYLRLGDILLGQKKIQEAIDVYAKAPGVPDDSATGIYNAAVQLWNAKDLDATIAALDRGIQVAPNAAFLYRLKANCYVGKNKKPEAIQAIKDAIRVAKPDDPETKEDREMLKALGGQ